jgi:hypothetical protein
VAAARLIRRGYHENIVEHYENPRNVGSLDKNDKSVGTVRSIAFLFARADFEKQFCYKHFKSIMPHSVVLCY